MSEMDSDQMKTLSVSDNPHRAFRIKNDSPLATAVKNCNAIFIEIEAALDSIDNSSMLNGKLGISRPFAQRSRWPMRKSRLKEMLMDLEKNKTTLILGLQITEMIERSAILR
jgi:hypothetical protein